LKIILVVVLVLDTQLPEYDDENEEEYDLLHLIPTVAKGSHAPRFMLRGAPERA
jgi:hypothetical protein